jgi:hypothetical protein
MSAICTLPAKQGNGFVRLCSTRVQLAKRFKVSPQRIGQLEQRALLKIRLALLDDPEVVEVLQEMGMGGLSSEDSP